MGKNPLADELEATRGQLRRLERAAERQRRGEGCFDGEHEWRSKGSVAAASGFAAFDTKVTDLTGISLPHPGYVVLHCIVCGQWGLTDYCSGSPETDRVYNISAEAAAKLL